MNKKKLLTAFVAVSTFACNVQVFGANFADMNDVPWDGAKSYINSVADLGLMAGDYNDNGKLVFRGKGLVTYCETMQLIYALDQKTSGRTISPATQTKWTSVMNGYKIPTWVQPAVAYGLENSIVTISDIPGFINNKGQSVNATRQDVAVMFGRAMKNYGTINSSASLNFGDASTISAVAVPYVDLLNKLGVLSGDTDGNFNPRNTINRAEMSVLVSKSYNVMKSGTTSNGYNSIPVSQAGSITGTVTAVTPIGNNTAITVDGDSSTMSFTGSSITPVINGSTRVLLSSLTVGDKVVASYSGQDLISVLVTAKASSTTTRTDTRTSEVTGSYVSISSSYIKLKVNSSSRTYYFINDNYDNTTFYVDDSKSTYSKFKDAADTDQIVRLVLDSKGQISKAYIEDEIKGTFVSMSKKDIRIKVSGSSKTYDFEDDDRDEVTFRIDGSKSTYSKVDSKASSGDTIELTLDGDGDVKEVNLISKDNGEGTFVSMSKKDIRVKVKGSSKTYDFVNDDYDDVTFKIDGSRSTYSKVDSKASRSHTVKLSLNSRDEVTEVNLITEDEDVEGTFIRMSEKYIRIKVDGSSKTYDFEDEDYDDVTFKIDGSSSTHSKVDKKASGSYKVKLTLNSDNEVTVVNLITDDDDDDDDEIKGTFVSLRDSYIKIKESKSSSSTKYYFEKEDSSNVTFYYNGSSKSYSYIDSHVKDGDDVKLTMSRRDVIKVYITEGSSSDKSGKLTYLSSSKLKISGDSYDFENSNRCDIDIKDGRSTTIDDFNELEDAYDDNKEMQLEITLNRDDEVTEITGYVSEVKGEVTSVSTSDDTIRVRTRNTTVDYKLDRDTDIRNDDDYKNSVSGLKSAYDESRKDMEVELTLDKNGYVTRVDVSL